MNYEFDLPTWMTRFPLQVEHGRYSGDPITSPGHLCNREWLRQALADQIDWGPGVPVDIFVMSDGEPENRAATKIGGLPYRPADAPWPMSESGRPMALIAQFNFSNSADIVGRLPGDLLLVFGWDDEDGFIGPQFMEWQRLGISNLIDANRMPPLRVAITPCYGNRCRLMSYPDSKPRFKTKYPEINGKEVWAAHFIPVMHATQIGRAPFFVQSDDAMLPGRPLCCVASVQPDSHAPYPWVNVAEPRNPPGVWRWCSDDGYLMIGDAGCIYISIDEDGTLHTEESCF